VNGFPYFNMTENEKIAKAFAEQFSPALKYIRTERINNVPMQDAWQISYWDDARATGVTAVVFAGQIHAYLESAGPGSIAADSARAFAKALGLRGDLDNGTA